MACTRIYDDPHRVAKLLQLQTQAGRYALNVPGNGTRMPFQEDPFCRLQHWGANIHSDMLAVNEFFRGTARVPLTRKDAVVLCAGTLTEGSRAGMYGTASPYTDQSRATDPAWVLRNLETPPRWNFFGDPADNPQNHVDLPFTCNTGTRMSEKDDFAAQQWQEMKRNMFLAPPNAALAHE